MNKYKYILTRSAVVFFSLIGTIISFFIKYDNKRIIFNAINNNKYDSNSKYLFLWFVKNIKDYKSYFVINNDKQRNELNNTIGNYFIETKSLKGKIFALRASIWIISSLSLPVGCIFAKYKRFVIHVGHGIPLKNIGLLEKKVSIIKHIYYNIIKTNISFAIAPSPYFQTIISKFLNLPVEKILIGGSAKHDQLFVESDLDMQQFSKQKGMKHILYAPTWRHSSKVNLFPFRDFSYQELANFLSENRINIFIRVHPNFEEEIDPKLLEILNIHLFSGTVYNEIIDYLNKFNLLITDYSGIYFEYLLLNRPVIFLPYDYDLYEKEIGFPLPYNEFTPGYKPDNMKDFMHAILKSFDNDIYKNDRERINKICNSFEKDNCKEFVKLLYNKRILSE